MVKELFVEVSTRRGRNRSGECIFVHYLLTSRRPTATGSVVCGDSSTSATGSVVCAVQKIHGEAVLLPPLFAPAAKNGLNRSLLEVLRESRSKL